MSLTLFLKVETEDTFVFQKNVAYQGKKSKDNVPFSKGTLRTSLKHATQKSAICNLQYLNACIVFN